MRVAVILSYSTLHVRRLAGVTHGPMCVKYIIAFLLTDWVTAGLNVRTAAKRELYMVNDGLVIKTVGRLGPIGAEQVERALCEWLGLP